MVWNPFRRNRRRAGPASQQPRPVPDPSPAAAPSSASSWSPAAASSPPAPVRRAPGGLVQEIPFDPAPEPPPPPEPPSDLDGLAPVAPPPPLVRLAGRFSSASSALTFVSQLGGSGSATASGFGRSADSTAWWVHAVAPLAAAREQIHTAHGGTFLEVDGALVRDRGWGDTAPEPAARSVGAVDDIEPVGLLALVRVAGLARGALPVPAELAVIVPGKRLARLVQRALDYQLKVSYRPVGLQPLFADDDGSHAGETTMFQVQLTTPTLPASPVAAPEKGTLPPSLVAALEQDPFLMPCRQAGEKLLIQHPLTSPLPDAQLAKLAESDPGDGIWVLGGPGYPSSRLHPHGELLDSAALVRLADDYLMIDLDPAQDGIDPVGALPSAPTLRLVHARCHGVGIAAVLLDDDDLAALPALLEGRPLADIALLVRGRDRHLLLPPGTRDQHLLLAPGGLLERLPVGDPLHCIGPGLLYVPWGYRLQPQLPPSARRVLFPTDTDTAIVLQPDAALRFSLTGRKPVWTLWAGELPTVDHQLSPESGEVLAEVDRRVTPPPAAVPARHIGLMDRLREPPANTEDSWRNEAFELEAAGDFAGAARLHEQHKQLLRAAHLYERAARDPRGS